MQNLDILNSKQTKVIRKSLEAQFGFEEKLEYAFMKNAKGKVYVINKEVGMIDLSLLRIDLIGMYFGTVLDNDGGFRLSIEGSQIIGPKATKGIIDLDEEQFVKWLKGEDFPYDHDSGLIIARYNSEYLGCGVIKDKTLLNHVPKSRRLIVVNN